MKESRERVINLEKASETFGFSPNELLQREEYEKFYETLESLHEQKKRMGLRENDKGESFLDEISKCQVHDAIFISGERGSGKTTFLHSIKGFIKEKSKTHKKYNFLPIIDPTLLHYNEEFLVITISHIVNNIESNQLQCTQDDKKKRDFYSLLKDISESINSINKNDSVIERMINSQNSLQLEQKVHKFFKLVTEICNCEMIILPIDDIDMSFSHGFNVLETIRKFLSSPYIIPVVSGAPELYATIVEKQFAKKVYSKFTDESAPSDSLLLGENDLDLKAKLKRIEDEEDHTMLAGVNSLNWKRKVRVLSDRYFEKVFPVDKRINLPGIDEILKRCMPRLMVKSSNEILTPLNEIYKTFCQTFNAPISWTGLITNEYAYNPIPLDSLRSFTQYLCKMKRIINTGENLKISGEYTGGAIREFFANTEDFFSNVHNKQFEYLCAKASLRKPAESRSIRDILYSEFFDPAVNPNNKPALEEIIKNENIHFLQRESCHSLLRIGGLIQFYTDIFTYRDYYSSYQQKYFIVAGKFIEFIWRSCDYSFCDGEKTDYSEYKEIIEAKQQHREGRRSAFLEIPPNNYFEPSMSDEDKDEDEMNKEIILDTKREKKMRSQSFYFMDELIVKWKKNCKLDETAISASFIYKTTNKFSHNLNRMYDQNISESVLGYITRVCLIFLNSIALFERVNKGISISETNIAMSKKLSSESLLKLNSSAYRYNIAPQLSKPESLTYYFYNHPLIYIILNNKLPEYFSFENNAKKQRIMDAIKNLSKLDDYVLGSGKPKERIEEEAFAKAKTYATKINLAKKPETKATAFKSLIEIFEQYPDKKNFSQISKRLNRNIDTSHFFGTLWNEKDELILRYQELFEKLAK